MSSYFCAGLPPGIQLCLVHHRRLFIGIPTVQLVPFSLSHRVKRQQLHFAESQILHIPPDVVKILQVESRDHRDADDGPDITVLQIPQVPRDFLCIRAGEFLQFVRIAVFHVVVNQIDPGKRSSELFQVIGSFCLDGGVIARILQRPKERYRILGEHFSARERNPSAGGLVVFVVLADFRQDLRYGHPIPRHFHRFVQTGSDTGSAAITESPVHSGFSADDCHSSLRACSHAPAASHAQAVIMKQLRFWPPGFGIGTPGTVQGTALEEHHCADARTVVGRKPLDIGDGIQEVILYGCLFCFRSHPHSPVSFLFVPSLSLRNCPQELHLFTVQHMAPPQSGGQYADVCLTDSHLVTLSQSGGRAAKNCDTVFASSDGRFSPTGPWTAARPARFCPDPQTPRCSPPPGQSGPDTFPGASVHPPAAPCPPLSP